MEKKSYQIANAIGTLGRIAMDIVEFYNQGREADAKAKWNELVGASRVFAIAFDDGETNPIHRHVFPTLHAACVSFDVDYDSVIDFLRK